MSKRVLSLVFLLLFAASAWAADFPSRTFECIAPAGPGGGWDTTMRMVTKVLKEKGFVTQAMPVVNKPGGGGGVALAYIARKKDPHVITVYSPPLLLINLTGQTPLSYRNVTPIAMMINDFGAFVVPKNSPYRNIKDVFEALKKDPRSVKVGGASSPGSMDHIQFLQAAKAAGVTGLKDIPYVAFQGGEALAALLGGHIDLYSTGMAEIVGPLEAGELLGLALTSPQRVADGPLANVPTLREEGIDAVFINWRGIFGIPDMPEEARAFMEDALSKVAGTEEWKAICRQNGWTEAYMGSAEFAAFLERTNAEYQDLLKDIGLHRQQ
ncbi:tripartite tricarboxylate transporter substrate binding protein [Fretibacterium sp. OH1220_COT-178]|uniref:tripartite tricarboxylate transporter substrate binding protein n=1 Tax=Fretibacterium sp. OH1220_COT-178 TaxID=2491047 RepID=UPI000F5E7412|nr:tripartite tricarboxylate transporter substrate binding protein [Fretibacterium sp. OH1220_COT-178]RRD65301.1 tripartite tricarboxylate transporter substrate binding protein [Fretibacterium sp. OH1220_COT-178]